MRFARDVDAGTVWINTYRSASFMSANGGFKNSGYGRRGGFEVMREFSRLKNVMIDYSGADAGPVRHSREVKGGHRTEPGTEEQP